MLVTDMNDPTTFGAHWRMFDEHDDETVMEHFKRWFWSSNPMEAPSLILDPDPVGSRTYVGEGME